MVLKDTKSLAVTAVFTALMCVLGPISLEIGPVPISLGIFAIFLTVYVLGTEKSMMAVIAYLIIGCAGLPVFAGFSAGASKLFGPTGGYLIGYIFMALIAGAFTEHVKSIPAKAAGMILGLLVCYAIGTVWLKAALDIDMKQALMLGVIPFIIPDLLKLIASIILGEKLKERLHI